MKPDTLGTGNRTDAVTTIAAVPGERIEARQSKPGTIPNLSPAARETIGRAGRQ